MKSNFTQALRELTGFDGQADAPEKSAGQPAENQDFQEEITYSAADAAGVTSVKEFSAGAAEGSTCITKHMSVSGDIKSEDDVCVDGQLVGNLKTNASVRASDMILGDVAAAAAVFSGARVKGNLAFSEDLVIGEGSVIVGDIKCGNADIAGKVKGNCSIEGAARLASSALVAGDITAGSIATEQGAKIIGTIRSGDNKINVDAEFDFGGDLA